MKEAAAHINTPAPQNRIQPFFQRSAEESREDSAFFSGIQTKLTVAAKDDPYEKEADAMADKVVNKKAIQPKLEVAEKDDPNEKEADAMADKVVNKKPGDVQMKTEEHKEEEKNEKEKEGMDKKINKKPIAGDDDNDNTIQRMCRECDEGDRIFRSPGDPDISGMGKRDAVIAMAKTMLGKIKAKQPGGGGERYGAKELWEIFKLAAPGIWQEDDIKTFGKPYPSWCGIFSVWAHKKAGIDLGNWQMGKGVTAFGTLKQTTSPQPGDIGYIDQPFQHHCIITKVNGDTIDSIDGNSGLFSEVIENTRQRTVYTGFFTAHSGASSGTVNKKEIEGSVQKQADGKAGTAPTSVETSLASSKGGGTSLPENTRSEMESGFGADFSTIKIHTDSNAAQMSRQLEAHAFTHGSDIYFNENKYDAETKTGKQLLAHELTHTIQQGAAGVQKKDDGFESSKVSRKIQKKAITSSDIEAPVIVGNSYEIKLKDSKLTYTINLDEKVLEMPKISLPGLKQRNEKLYTLPILSVRGRGETLQVENWVNAVKSVINAKVYDFLKGENPGMDDSTVLYYKLKKKKDFHIIGNFKKIQEMSYIPKWGRTGLPNNHQVDHIVEHQLGGADQPGTKPSNYELLDSKANMSSGNAIRQERYRRINEALGYFNDINNDKKGTFPNLPTSEQVKDGYINKFGTIADWKLPYNGDGKIYWTYDELSKAIHLQQLEKMTPAEINAIQGSATEALIYVGEGLGTPKRLKIPFAGSALPDFYLGMDLTNFTTSTAPPVTGTPAGTIEFTLNKKFTKRLKTGDNLKFDLMPVEGRLNTFYIKTSKQFNKNMFTKFEGLSPITINGIELDETRGLMLTGTITCDVPLLKELNIDFYLAGGEMGFSTFISADFISKYFPKPFNVTNAGLEISYSTKDNNLNLIGNIDFEVEKLGKGSIKGGKSKDGFMVAGDFIFDKSLFNGKIHFSYVENKWTIGGSATMDGKKLKGIKTAKIDFEYSQEKENLHVGGEATLTVPGISKVTINTDIGKDGDFKVTAGVILEKIPRIKSGNVTVTIGKTKPAEGQPQGDSEWDLGITGTIEPDFNYDGLKDVKVKFGYAKGAYDISISAKYTRGKIHADVIEVGLTNKPVSADGKKQDGEPTKDMTFYGELKMSMDIYDGISGGINCKLLPDGDITLDGTVDVKEDKPMFSVNPLNKEIFKVDKDIPIASCVVVTLNLFIGGSIKLYADIKPLMIKQGSYVKVGNLSLKKYDDPHITSKIILGSSLVAGAKVTLAIGLSASLLGIIKARIKGQAGVDFVALEAAITGILEMGWSKGSGLEINEASISVEMASKLKVSFAIVAEVLIDLWLTTITVWDHTWPVAEETFPINLFGNGKKTWKLPIESGGKVGQPKMEDNLKDINEKSTPEEVQKRAENKSKGVGQTNEDKQAQVQQVTQDEVIANFKKPERFKFDKSENYLETRYGLYDYLKLHSGLDPKIDLNFIDEEIRKAEFEEYDAFTLFIMNDTSFNDDSKSIIIEDFIINHPTLGATEKANLRSLIPVKAPASQKASVKNRGKSVPKKTPEVTTPVRPVQKKAKAGGSGKSGSVTGRRGKHVLKNKSQKNAHKTSEGNEFTEMEDGMLIPDMELSTVNDFYNDDFEDNTPLTTINDIEDGIDNNENNHFKSFNMRPYTRTRKPLRQRAEEKSKSPFFSGPEKKEKKANNTFFQAKAEAGGPDDKLEKEADSMADKAIAKQPPADVKKEEPPKPVAPQEEQKDKKPVQKKENGTEEKKDEENKPVSKKDNNTNTTAPKTNSAEAAISEKNGTGKRLPENTQKEMGQTFGNDFSDVNIHTDEDATQLSQELGAQAFTQGKDIYFNEGKYNPETSSGKHLLAHELTHVVQQDKGRSGDIQPYRDRSKTHFGTKNTGDLVEDSFNKKDKKEKETKPWIKEINIDFTLEKKDDSRKMIPIGIASAIYEDNAAKLPPIIVGITGGSKELGKTRSGKFTVHRIEGVGYSDVPLAGGEGPNKKYAKQDASGGFSASMHFAIFFDAGRALHTGALEESSHGCIHVDPGNSKIMQMNYHAVVGLTKVNVNFAPGLEKGVNKGVDVNPTKTKIIEEFDAFISAGRFADSVTKVQELPESDREVVLRTTSDISKAEMYTTSVQGTSLDKFDALGNLTRSAYLDVNYKANLRVSNWEKAAEFLNGFNSDDIKERLLRLDKTKKDKLHAGALANPALGPGSQIAIMTTP